MNNAQKIRHRCQQGLRRLSFSAWLLLAGTAALFQTGVQAADDPAAVQALAAKLTPLNALSGHFSQTQTDAGGEVLSRSSGEFTMQRPGLLRWETTEPFPQLLVTDGVKIWLYDEDLEQVTISAVTNQLNQTPAIIFSGDLLKIEQNFQVTDHGDSTFTLRPKANNDAFQRLNIEFQDGLIQRMIILDGFGQTTEFLLSEVKREGPLPISLFQFVPQPSTDVLMQD